MGKLETENNRNINFGGNNYSVVAKTVGNKVTMFVFTLHQLPVFKRVPGMRKSMRITIIAQVLIRILSFIVKFERIILTPKGKRNS